MIVGAVVLATGRFEREGLLPFRGKPIIESTLDALETAGISQQIVVLGADPQEVIEVIRPRVGRVKIALDLTPELGLVSSFQAGLIVIQQVDAAFLIFGDQPILDPALLTTMAKTMESDVEALIVCPVSSGGRGHPMLFHRKLFGEILSLRDPQTIDDVIRGHMDKLVMIESPSTTFG